MGVGDERKSWLTAHGLVGRQISSQIRKSDGEGTGIGRRIASLPSTSTKQGFLEEVTYELRLEGRKEELKRKGELKTKAEELEIIQGILKETLLQKFV